MHSVDIYIKDGDTLSFILSCTGKDVKGLFKGIKTRDEFFKILKNDRFQGHNSVRHWPWDWNSSKYTNDVIVWIDEPKKIINFWKCSIGNCWVKDDTLLIEDNLDATCVMLADINSKVQRADFMNYEQLKDRASSNHEFLYHRRTIVRIPTMK
jgi:hypothetical protein